MPATTPQPDDKSDLFTGRSQKEVAKLLGISEHEVRAAEKLFRLRLAIALQADPKTRHLAPRDFQAFLSKL